MGHESFFSPTKLDKVDYAYHCSYEETKIYIFMMLRALHSWPVIIMRQLLVYAWKFTQDEKKSNLFNQNKNFQIFPSKIFFEI